MNLDHTLIAPTLPTGWRVMPFWSLFRRKKRIGYEHEELLSVYRDYGVIPKSSRDDNHNKESEDLSGYQLVKEGSLVTNKMKAWQGSIAISRYRGIVSPAYYVYDPTSRECDQFLHYLLRSDPYINLYGRISKGVRVNQWDLEHEALRNIPVLLPDIATQCQIADFLDRETSRIDLLIEKKQRLVEITAERLRSALNSLLLEGVSQKDSFTPMNLEWLSRLPSPWTLTKLKFLGIGGERTTQMGPFGGMLTALSSSETEFKLYGQENTISRDFRKGSRWLSKETFLELSRYELQPGDIVLTRKGTLGKCASFPSDAQRGIADSDTIRIRLNHSVFSHWMLENTLQYAAYISGQIELEKRGAILAGLNTSIIDNLYLAVPPMCEQRKIEVIGSRMLANSSDLQRKFSVSITRLREYRSALGRVDKRDSPRA